MAEPKKSVELDVVERNWLRKSVETQRQVLIRSRGREEVGSEVYGFRSKEIAALDALLERLR